MKNVTPDTGTVDESSERLLVAIGYVLFLIGPANFLTMLIAAVIAWLRYDKVPEWLATHYAFQLRTLVYAVVLLLIALACAVTVILLPISIVIWLLWSLWVIVRVVVGLIRLVDGRPNPDPTTFWV
jgi:uncharacterized membrane protein